MLNSNKISKVYISAESSFKECYLYVYDNEKRITYYRSSYYAYFIFQNVRLAAAEINQFETAKVKVVARTKSEDIIVDKPGLVQQSSIDKKVKFVFPRDTFTRPTRVKLQVSKIMHTLSSS